MDPTEALRLYILAASRGDADEMGEHHHALMTWLWKGGHAPDHVEACDAAIGGPQR